jgi:hypothetical protein
MSGVSASTAVTVVLVHGGFVDGSGLEGVYRALKKSGHSVAVVQNSTASTRRRRRGHEPRTRGAAGSGGPRRAFVWRRRDHRSGQRRQGRRIVYVAAFARDRGESVSALIKEPPPGAPVPPVLPPQDGWRFLDKAKFAASFAGDLDAEKAAFLANSQVPWGVGALDGAITEPAWKSRPRWYLVATEDRIIPPAAARDVEARGLHDGRGLGQSRDLRVAAGSRGRADRGGGRGSKGGRLTHL